MRPKILIQNKSQGDCVDGRGIQNSSIKLKQFSPNCVAHTNCSAYQRRLSGFIAKGWTGCFKSCLPRRWFKTETVKEEGVPKVNQQGKIETHDL